MTLDIKKKEPASRAVRVTKTDYEKLCALAVGNATLGEVVAAIIEHYERTSTDD